jgi:NAD(P)H-flavin reductase
MQFWLLFGARRESDIYYREEFEQLAAKHANFHFLPTLSRAEAEWKGLRGYVQEHLPENRRNPYRHARLHLRPGQDGQSKPRIAEEFGLGSNLDPL